MVFYDAHEQLQHRTSLTSHLKPTMIKALQQIITPRNPYAAHFLTLYQQHGSQAIGALEIRTQSGRDLVRRYDALQHLTITNAQGQQAAAKQRRRKNSCGGPTQTILRHASHVMPKDGTRSRVRSVIGSIR